MKKTKFLTGVLLAALPLMWGCATYDSSVPASTGIGAAGGALLGYGLTGSAAGAAAGAGAGALAGALTGVAIDETRRSQAVARPAYPAAGPPPQASRYAATVDPTRGELVNQTGWRLKVFVDESTEPIWVEPGGITPLELDVGAHEIMATAYVDTKFGERVVGSYTRRIEVDPRGSGWSLRLEERMFR